MSPSEFMQQYREMTVLLDDNQCGPLAPPRTTVDVHQYVINSTKPESKRHNAEKAMAEYAYVIRLLESQLNQSQPVHSGQLTHIPSGPGPMDGPRGFHVPAHRHKESPMLEDLHSLQRRTRMRAVQSGKGSPEAIAAYLSLAVRAGATTVAGLQDFADKYVGIDCSGFVLNYMIAIGKMAPDEVFKTHSSDTFAKNHPKRMSLESLSDLDIMVWFENGQIGGHVAIMEGPVCAKAGTQATVVESNGGRGLDSETYTFTLDKKIPGLFHGHRETEKGKPQQLFVYDWNL